MSIHFFTSLLLSWILPLSPSRSLSLSVSRSLFSPPPSFPLPLSQNSLMRLQGHERPWILTTVLLFWLLFLSCYCHHHSPLDKTPCDSARLYCPPTVWIPLRQYSILESHCIRTCPYVWYPMATAHLSPCLYSVNLSSPTNILFTKLR